MPVNALPPGPAEELTPPPPTPDAPTPPPAPEDVWTPPGPEAAPEPPCAASRPLPNVPPPPSREDPRPVSNMAIQQVPVPRATGPVVEAAPPADVPPGPATLPGTVSVSFDESANAWAYAYGTRLSDEDTARIIDAVLDAFNELKAMGQGKRRVTPPCSSSTRSVTSGRSRCLKGSF